MQFHFSGYRLPGTESVGERKFSFKAKDRSHIVISISMKPLARLPQKLLRKIEDNAAAEGIRLRESNNGRLRVIGTAIGILVVILVALWMNHHR